MTASNAPIEPPGSPRHYTAFIGQIAPGGPWALYWYEGGRVDGRLFDSADEALEASLAFWK